MRRRIAAAPDVFTKKLWRDDMRRWDEDNAMHKLGRFTYSLEEIGLDEATIRDRMASSFELLDMIQTRRDSVRALTAEGQRPARR